jgi:hypothetical protein
MERLTIALTLTLSLSLVSQAGVARAFTNATRASSQPSHRQRANATTTTAPATLSSLAPRAATAGVIRFARRLIKEKNSRLKYTIDVHYPQIIGAREASAVEFNRAVKEMFTGAINEFKKDIGVPDGSVPDAAYSIEYSSPDLISVAFNVSPYYAGAAHPQHYSTALNYDLKAGRTLQLSDLFKPRSNHLQVISAYAIEALKKELGAESDSDWIATGAAPDSKNYQSWNITSRGLSITFDPYQVASYAEGEHVVVIPYAALRNIINMDGPLAPLAMKGKSKAKVKR